jgi:hypothetical protein
VEFEPEVAKHRSQYLDKVHPADISKITHTLSTAKIRISVVAQDIAIPRYVCDHFSCSCAALVIARTLAARTICNNKELPRTRLPNPGKDFSRGLLAVLDDQHHRVEPPLAHTAFPLDDESGSHGEPGT